MTEFLLGWVAGWATAILIGFVSLRRGGSEKLKRRLEEREARERGAFVAEGEPRWGGGAGQARLEPMPPSLDEAIAAAQKEAAERERLVRFLNHGLKPGGDK